MGKEVNLTFERRVGGESQYSDKYLEWISSQKRKSYDTHDSRGRQVRVKINPTHTWVKRTVECPLPADAGPDRVVREWRSVLSDDGVTCSGNGESRYPDAQGTPDGRQRNSWSDTTRHYGRAFVGDVRHCHLVVAYSSWFCSVACFFFRTVTHHSWKLGRGQVRFRHRDEIEAQIQWLISSVRQRLAKGCLVSVEGTWFNEHGVLSELSGVADSVTGESFEVLRGVSPQLDAAWGTASARMKTVLEAEPQHQTPTWEGLIAAALEEAADRNTYMAYQQKHTKKMLSSEDRWRIRPEIRGSLCPEQNYLKQREWNRMNWTNLCCQP